MNITFEETIKPYFTPCYRAHMLTYGQYPFDLCDIVQVQGQWGQIFNQVQAKSMPATGCPEGVWDDVTRTQFLSDFQAWKTGGYVA